VKSLVGHDGPVFGIAVSPDGKFAASGGADRSVLLWNLADGTFIRAFLGHEQPIWSLTFTPDSQHLLSAGADEVVRVWNLASGEEIGVNGQRRRPSIAHLSDGEPDSRGAELFAKCAVCHTVGPDGGRRAGPSLYGVFGRRAGTVDGYRYSDALKDSELVWGEVTIDALFNEGPAAYTPGSKMPLQRMSSPEDRAELIAYLKRITAPME
jgi:cytochrome c